MDQTHDIPLGVRFLNRFQFVKQLDQKTKTYGHRFNVLLLTFLSYSSYHLARKPTSVAKNVLHQNCTGLTPSDPSLLTEANSETWCKWSPFDGNDGDALLGTMDSVFLFAYAFGMYFTGPLAERWNLRYFLCSGMILSGLFTFCYGIAYWLEIHSLTYFIIIQALAGLCQSTGWPGCVTAVGNWFGKDKRGLIMGIWRSNHSVGNMIGSLVAAAFVEYNWGLSFIVPAVITIGVGLLLFVFLVPDPRAVGCALPDHSVHHQDDVDPTITKEPITKEDIPAPDTSSGKDESPISFWQAVLIPGVIEFSLCLFFSKLVNYTFLYWLPRYIKESGLNLGDKASADLSTLLDAGGIFGGILAGYISDVTGMSAVTCAVALLLSIPMLFVYQLFGGVSVAVNISLLVIVGFLINVPYALITTSVSADLGTRPDLRHSSRALATVTAIIDGTGSIGAAIGPLMAGPLSRLGWDYVFYTLMVASGLALLLLSRLIKNEIYQLFPKKLSVNEKYELKENQSAVA